MKSLAENTNPWSESKKIIFRFGFIYFLLFILLVNNGAFPYWYVVMSYPDELLKVLIPWVGKNILHLSYDITVFTNGSGDTTYDYVLVLCIFVISIFSVITWTIFDRNNTNYNKLYYWLIVGLRYYVALMLIRYGISKVIQFQFSPPSLNRLTQIYGDSSPMGLAWTFLGFSKGYNIFMGLAEVAAVLLLFRRTMTLGAIITLMTTANVMAINYFYDVPVKIVSTSLFIITLCILMRDFEKLWKLFVLGKQVSLNFIEAPIIKKRWLKYSKLGFKYLLIAYALIYGFIEVLGYQKEYAKKPRFYGIHEVKTYIHNQDTLPPLVTDTVRWYQLVIQWEGYARINYMNDSIARCYTKIDTVSQKLDIILRTDSTQIYSFNYEQLDSGRLYLNGKIGEDSVKMYTKLKNANSFRLTSRGFNWINEYPYNR